MKGLLRWTEYVVSFFEEAWRVFFGVALLLELTRFVNDVAAIYFQRKEYESGVGFVTRLIILETTNHRGTLETIWYLLHSVEPARPRKALKLAKVVLDDVAATPIERSAAYQNSIQACFDLPDRTRAHELAKHTLEKLPDS